MEGSDGSPSFENQSARQPLQLKKLTLEQVLRIDEILDSLGEYGELHLIIQRGELRYINKVESFKAWKTRTEK
jgi:hypothetical protein